MKPRVLVSVPDVSKHGGIANYYRALRPYLPDAVQYVRRGSRPGERGWFQTGTRLIRDMSRFASMLIRIRPMVVHVNTSFGRSGLFRDATFIWLAKRMQIPVLAFIRGWDSTFELRVHQRTTQIALSILFKADVCLVLAEEFAARLKEWGYRGKLVVETTAVADELTAGLDTERIRRRARDVDRPFTVLFLARVERSKGIHEAIEAVDYLRGRTTRPVRMVVAGDGSELDAARARAADLGCDCVKFVGYVRGAEKRSVLHNSDVYLLPTRHGEGLPNSVLEAMACGLPVITRPVGGIADLFRGSRMGFVTESHDAKEFGELLRIVVEDDALREVISVYNCELASTRFLASRVANRLLAQYEAIIMRNGGSSLLPAPLASEK